MNKDRRKQIADAIEQLELIKGKLEDTKELIENIRDAEQECFDNLTGKLWSKLPAR
jgi:uncharacterized protein Yka (UPF0111/DUF47 family)